MEREEGQLCFAKFTAKLQVNGRTRKPLLSALGLMHKPSELLQVLGLSQEGVVRHLKRRSL